jgi:hypothetical protein
MTLAVMFIFYRSKRILNAANTAGIQKLEYARCTQITVLAITVAIPSPPSLELMSLAIHNLLVFFPAILLGFFNRLAFTPNKGVWVARESLKEGSCIVGSLASQSVYRFFRVIQCLIQ